LIVFLRNPYTFSYNVFTEKSGVIPLISSKIQHCVEQLCAEGCQSVRRDIARLEQGKEIPLIEDLKAEEKQQVLSELKTIMAVYDK